MLKFPKTNGSTVIAALLLLFFVPQSVMATGGGEPEVSINKWGAVALVAAACLAYRLTKK